MSLLDSEKNTAARAVYDALPLKDGADHESWSSSADVVAAVGYSKSTVNDILRKLVASGDVEAADGARVRLYRALPREAEVPAGGVQMATDEDTEALDTWVGDDDPEEDAAAGPVADVLASMRAAAPDVAAAIAAGPAAPVTVPCTHRGCGLPTIKRGRTRVHEFADADVDHKATTRVLPERKPRPERERAERAPATRADGTARFKGDPSTFHAKGALRSKVVDHLRALKATDPEATRSATQLARELPGTQAGAVQYALNRATVEGELELAQEAPKRYRAA